MPLDIQVNGQPRHFPDLCSPTTLDAVVTVLELKADRIAVECDGEIAPRGAWAQVEIREGSRLEIVHFVGGGAR